MELAVKILLGYYLIINLVLLVAMGYDKHCAKKGAWRIPESTLFIMALLGGGIGGFAAIFLFNHKKRKPQFHIIYMISIILHTVFFYFLITNIL